MNLKEMLAAKKAAAAAAAAQAHVITGVSYPVESKPVEQPVSMIAAAEPVAEQPPTAPAEPPKVLTFAEKLALKKQGIQQAQATPAPKAPALVIDPSTLPEDSEQAQAYVDIKNKIHALESAFDDDLRGAMKELKEALKKNPAASELLLDSDVGKMVIALRRMTHVEIAAAKEPKKPGRKSSPKAKDVQLTAEEIERVFADEL